MIGMGAIVLNGAVLGDNCLVGAGAVVTGKTCAEPGSVLLGSPAKVVKMLPEGTWASGKEIEKSAKSSWFTRRILFRIFDNLCQIYYYQVITPTQIGLKGVNI